MTKNSRKRDFTPFIFILAPFLLSSLVLTSVPRILEPIDSKNSNENSAENIDKSAKSAEALVSQSPSEDIIPKETNIKPTENVSEKPESTKVEPAQPQQPSITEPTPIIEEYPTVSSIGRLVIDSIGLDAAIEEVGTTNNQIDVPHHNVGWFNGSAGLNSTSGTSFFDGHSDGIFINLQKAKIGQTISVINGNSIKTYKVEVISTENLIGLSMLPTLNYYKYPNRGISLMTCAGTYDPSRGTYTQRLIIYAKLV